MDMYLEGDRVFCYKCGTEIDDDAKFCYKCGASQELDNEPVKMRPAGVAGGTIEGQQHQTKRVDGPTAVYHRPAEEKVTPDPVQKNEGDQDQRKKKIIPVIIIIAVIAAAVVILLLFRDRLGFSFNRSSQATESAVMNEDGGNGGSTGAAIAESSSNGSSEEEKVSAAEESAGASSMGKDEEQTSDISSEKADAEETDDAVFEDKTSSAGKNDSSADKSSSAQADSTDKASTPQADSTDKASTPQTDSTNKASTAQADSTDKASADQDDSNKVSSSGRPKTTGNNTDQMALPGASQTSVGTAQTAAPTADPADSAVASVVMASTVSTSAYNKAVIQTIKASSELLQPGYDNSARSAVDGNTITSWQDGVSGYGEGQVLDMTLDKEYRVHCINFNLGNWRGQQYYNENSRPKQITLYLGTTRHYTVIFPDGMSQYTVMFSADVPASWIRVQIDSVYPGTLYDDTCISEMTIYASN